MLDFSTSLSAAVFPASPLRARVSAAVGMLSGGGRGRLPPSVHHVVSNGGGSLRSHAFDDLTALSFSPTPLSPLSSSPLLPAAPDQTHGDRGRDPEAQKQGRGV